MLAFDVDKVAALISYFLSVLAMILTMQTQWLGPSWLPAMHRVSIVHPGRLCEETHESGSVVHGDGATGEFAGATPPTKRRK